LSQKGERIYFSYKDNGSGFDTKLIDQSRGYGYEFIHELTSKFKNVKNEINGDDGLKFSLVFDAQKEDKND